MILDINTVQRHLNAVWKDWKIAGKLGNGTYGAVYEIYRNDLDTSSAGKTMTCALKVLYIESPEQGDPDSEPFAGQAVNRNSRQSRQNYRNRQSSLAYREPAAGQNPVGKPGIILSDRMDRQSGFDGQQRESVLLNTVSDAVIDDFIKNVSSEIRTMIDLKGNPHIVSIEDYHVTRDRHSCLIMIRMEKLNCLSKAICEGMQTMSRENVIRLGIDICKALESCERNNIIHRDIKPSNLFFGEKTGFKLGDFGISRTMEHVYMSMAMSGAGTPQYMAPEIYTGRSYNNRADIYSLGIVLYQLMNDSYLPFFRENLQFHRSDTESRRDACMRRMRGERLPMPARADSRLASVILKACSYYPEERYSTAREFRESLENCLAGTDPATGFEKPAKSDPSTHENRRHKKVEFPFKIVIGFLTAALLFTTGIYVGGKVGRGNSITSSGTAPAGVDADTGNTVSTALQEAVGKDVTTDVNGSTGEDVTPAVNGSTGEMDPPVMTEESFDPEEILTFVDPALESAIRVSLKLEDDQPITRGIAFYTKKLELGGGGKEENEKISDITGISAFTNLTELYMPTNNISDIDELSELKKLEKLLLESNKISDLTPLRDLENLRSLEVANNNISDISPIYDLNKLQVLDVIENKITSIQGIGSMRKLDTLRLGRNQITDISPLGELRDLQHLSFGYNNVEDISVLYQLPMLHVLTMNGNRIRDISPVLEMKELYWLEVAGNPIEDESVFDNLPESVTHLEK